MTWPQQPIVPQVPVSCPWSWANARSLSLQRLMGRFSRLDPVFSVPSQSWLRSHWAAHGRQLGQAYTNFHQETGTRQGQAGLGATGGASASPSRGALKLRPRALHNATGAPCSSPILRGDAFNSRNQFPMIFLVLVISFFHVRYLVAKEFCREINILFFLISDLS